MSALHTQYLTEIIEAHREGLRILRELAAAETDPAERRRLAIALVRARPIQDPEPTESAPSTPAPPRSKRPHPASRAETTSDHAAVNTAATAHASSDTAAAPITPLNPLPSPPPGFRDCTHPALPPYPGCKSKSFSNAPAQRDDITTPFSPLRAFASLW